MVAANAGSSRSSSKESMKGKEEGDQRPHIRFDRYTPLNTSWEKI